MQEDRWNSKRHMCQITTCTPAGLQLLRKINASLIVLRRHWVQVL